MNRRPVEGVRRAGPDDRDVMLDTFAAAFHDDPVVTFLQPNQSKRSAGIAAFAWTALRLPASRRESYVTDDGAAAAIWSPPDQWKLTGRETLPFVLRMLRTPLRTRAALRFFARADRLHVEEPHWYLDLVGTRPERQGQGLGAALLQPVLDRCDEEGLPVWTYSSNRKNLAFYYRLGFDVLDEVVLIDGAPPVFPILRRPRS